MNKDLPNRHFIFSSVFALLGLLISQASLAQYCAPTVNSGGVYLTQVKFDYSSSVVGGVARLSGNNGYSQTIGSSSGTIQRYWGAGLWYNVQNPSSTISKNITVKIFADWNGDGDFDDFMEDNATSVKTVGPSSNLGTGFSIIPPLTASGNIRVRFAVAEGSAPTPCGSFTGEAEDYIITVAGNSAPVLNTSATPFINDLLVSQTNSDGFAIAQFISSASPATLATDANDQTATQQVPRGLAIYSQTATNGTWQYKAGTGSWTAFGAVSASNALLLLGNGNSNYQDNVRIRFVPTSAGTASFSFYLWDGTNGTNGSYANITSTGGSTAFSSATQTASVNVVSSQSNPFPVFFSTGQQKIYNTSLSTGTTKAVDPSNFISAGDHYTANDISLNPAGSKLFWISGPDAGQIASANADGSALNTSVISGLNYAIGIAASPTRIFYTDWSPGVYSANPDGSGLMQLTGAGWFSSGDVGDIGDIEYANNKIYFVYLDNNTGTYRIMSANPDGSGLTELQSISNYVKGLYVTNSHLYWTEINTSATPVVSTLMKSALTGGVAQTLAPQTGRSFNDLVADEANSTVYVVAADASNSVASEIRAVSTSGGSLTTILSLEGQVTSLAMLLSNTSTLPVSLVKYEARLISNSKAQLEWTTAGEREVHHFLMEKSTDGVRFQPMASVGAKGTQAEGTTTYTLTDNNVAPGDNYFRLSEVGYSGQIKQLGIRQVSGALTGQLQLYPNPLTGTTVKINTGAFTNALKYKLIDASGRCVTSGAVKQQFQNLELGKLPKGYYLFCLSDGRNVPLMVN